MDGMREDSKYSVNYAMSHPGYGLNQQVSKGSVRNVPYLQSQIVKYEDDEDDGIEEDAEEEGGGRNVVGTDLNGSAQRNGDDDDDEDDDDGEDCSGGHDSVNMQRHPKKRKLKSLLLSYELAPRVPPPATGGRTPAPRFSYGGRNTLTDWTEHETFVLLEAWGDRFLQCGRKSLRSEEWQEVADRVSQVSRTERTDSQCRNRLDTLKKKYKKEKANLNVSRGASPKWVYYKKMDMLLSSTIQQGGVSRGVESRENVFTNPRATLSITNGLDETRDSAGNSDSQEGDDDSDLLPPKKLKTGSDRNSQGSFKLLADSINKFSALYEKIENSKIQQMIELEKMRMDFHRDLELQKRQILDKAQAEISKVRQGDYEDNDVSAENVSRLGSGKHLNISRWLSTHNTENISKSIQGKG